MKEPIKIYLIEDDVSTRKSVEETMRGEFGFAFSGAGEDSRAIADIVQKQADIVLLDLSLEHEDGLDLIEPLLEARPQIHILIHTRHDDARHLYPALERGASGYILKQETPAALIDAIHRIFRGELPMSPSIARRVKEAFQEKRVRGKKLASLTQREREVLKLIGEGLQNDEIASALGIGKRTVDTHIRHIYEKLQVNRRTEAAKILFQG